MTYFREPLEMLDGQVKIGDLILFDDGRCRAGNRVFDYGVPIDGHPFGGTCLLRRRLDEPTILEVPDGAECLRFEYSRLQATWYRHTPLESPEFEALQRELGNGAANVAFQLSGLGRELWNALLASCASTPWFAVSLAAGYLRFLIALVPLLLLMLVLSLLGALFGGEGTRAAFAP